MPSCTHRFRIMLPLSRNHCEEGTLQRLPKILRVPWHFNGNSPRHTRFKVIANYDKAVLPEYCQSIAQDNIARRIAKILPEYCKKYCENIARILRKTILPEYCQNIAWLTHIAKLLESPNHQCSRMGRRMEQTLKCWGARERASATLVAPRRYFQV
jgi:hypothetical protein